jgi:hypothetical protein
MSPEIITLMIAILVCALGVRAESSAVRITGTVLDPGGRTVIGAHVELDSASGARLTGATGIDGGFTIALPAWGAYIVHVEATGFAPVTRRFDLSAATLPLTLRLEQVAELAQEVVVSADVSDIAIASPDPSQKVMVREELLDANPGRPGAPISIPGMPIETAAGGIKAPQYFVPGVAGDHGEPIAQYIAVGGFLVPNNLSANAHGNGYADPNIYVSGVLGSVGTDGGAYNVLEGNHALNMAATYSPRPQLRSFATLTGDYRDIDLTGGLAPSDSTKNEWLALECNYGNGLLKDMEHRKQFKMNALRVFDPGKHEITLFGIGYFGVSHEGNLVPIGYGEQLNDTLDRRQKDQTHTGLVAANDQWKAGTNDELAFSGFFRTYNLALFSNFGEGLIRQSEFRTVEGGEARETRTFTPWLEAMAGLVYNEDDLHNDNLDHYYTQYPSTDLYAYGPFLKVLANNITIREVAPYVALHGDLGKHVRFYAGLRHDQVEMKNVDQLKPDDSLDEWEGFENPKATVAFNPGTQGAGGSPAHWLPSLSFSVGQAFFTEDPRISVANSTGSNPPVSAGVPARNLPTPSFGGSPRIKPTPSGTATGAAALADPFERSHAMQLVLEKEFSGTDVRVTVGRTTMTATLAKIDPDNGLAEDLGPDVLKFLTVSARRQFGSYGTLQAIFSKADARLVPTGTTSAEIVPEAPRTIFDALATLDKLPLGLQAHSEYEYVGHKFLDVGNPQHKDQYEAIPVGETRLAVVRPFLNGRLVLGANAEIARGYTGQTTETMAPDWVRGQVPYCAGGVNGIANDFDCGTNEIAVGIRTVSWAGASVSWRFGSGR